MGVQGLWQLLDPLGRPVSLESLENKILAIDASIWLHQAVHGFRDKSNNPLPNAHLLGLFHRVCKLLFYGIKPVFVFDGAVPFLKRQTMSKRRDRQQNASRDAEKTYHQILQKYIQSKAIKEALGKKDSKSDINSNALSVPKNKTADIYDLPPLPSTSQSEIAAPHLNEESDDDEDDSDNFADDLLSSRISAFQDVDTIDFEAEDFKSLPFDIQHELLLEMKERNKRRYWIHHEPLPEKAEEIGSFQIKQLLYRRKLQSKIESLKKDLSATLTSQLSSEQGLGMYGDQHVLESQRIASEDSAHYILFKNVQTSFSNTKRFSSQASTSSSNAVSRNILKPSMENPVTASRNMWLESLSTARDKLHMKNTDKARKNVADASDNVALVVNTVNENGDQSSHSSGFNVDEDLTRKEKDRIPSLPTVTSESSLIFDGCEDLKEAFSADNTNIIKDTSTTSASIDTAAALLTFKSTEEELSKVKTQPRTPLIENNSHAVLDIDDSFASRDEKIFEQCIAVDTQNFEKQNQVAPNPVSLHGTDDSPAIGLISSSEDDDFLEVKIDPEKIAEDELFPLDVFQTFKSDANLKEHNASESLDKCSHIHEINEKSSMPEFEIIPPRDRADLLLLSEELDRETEVLVQDKGRQERIAATITEQMYSESQELLKLFGIPFVISPAEAEAQCAKMDVLDLTDGTITDDSDVWLFGARRVYKNFFENKRDVLLFSQADVLNRLKLDCTKLIAVAMLTGSDYTEGIKGVGIVTALEILAEFKEDNGFESLQKFSAWWKNAQEQKVAPSETKVKQKLRKLAVTEGFPSSDVLKAYLEPLVDSSKESFSWARPDLDALRHFASCKLNWAQEKTDGILLPIIKKFSTAKERQIRIDSFFPVALRSGEDVKHQSQRLKHALKKVGSLADSQDGRSLRPETKKPRMSRRKGTSTKRNMPKIAESATDLRLSEDSDSTSSEEERSAQPSKRKPLPAKKSSPDLSEFAKRLKGTGWM